MLIDLSEDEVLGLIEAVDRGLNDRNDYARNGSPHQDYGEEWPEIARDQSFRWLNCETACYKMGKIAMAQACRDLAVRLSRSATEFEEQNQTEFERQIRRVIGEQPK